MIEPYKGDSQYQKVLTDIYSAAPVSREKVMEYLMSPGMVPNKPCPPETRAKFFKELEVFLRDNPEMREKLLNQNIK